MYQALVLGLRLSMDQSINLSEPVSDKSKLRLTGKELKHFLEIYPTIEITEDQIKKHLNNVKFFGLKALTSIYLFNRKMTNLYGTEYSPIKVSHLKILRSYKVSIVPFLLCVYYNYAKSKLSDPPTELDETLERCTVPTFKVYLSRFCAARFLIFVSRVLARTPSPELILTFTPEQIQEVVDVVSRLEGVDFVAPVSSLCSQLAVQLETLTPTDSLPTYEQLKPLVTTELHNLIEQTELKTRSPLSKREETPRKRRPSNTFITENQPDAQTLGSLFGSTRVTQTMSAILDEICRSPHDFLEMLSTKSLPIVSMFVLEDPEFLPFLVDLFPYLSHPCSVVLTLAKHFDDIKVMQKTVLNAIPNLHVNGTYIGYFPTDTEKDPLDEEKGIENAVYASYFSIHPPLKVSLGKVNYSKSNM